MFNFEVDDTTEVVRCQTQGFWTMNDAGRFIETFRSTAKEARKRFGHLKILFDSRNMPVQSPKVNNCFMGLDKELCISLNDRVAILVSSSLLKIQAQRVVSQDYSQVFLSENAALTWLLAFVTDESGHGPLYRRRESLYDSAR